MKSKIRFSIYIISTLTLSFIYSFGGQQYFGEIKRSEHQIKIGEKVPDIEIQNVIFFDKPKLKFSDLKKKLIILDFFGTYCGPCINELPKLDSLQKKFNGKIQIIIVDHENKDRVLKFFNNNAIAKKINLPVICEDTSLGGTENSIFQLNSIPTEVWIDSNGFYIGTTDSKEVTAENIEKVLNYGGTGLAKKEFIEHQNTTVETLGKYNFFDNNLIQYSYFGKFQSQLGSGTALPYVDREKGIISLTENNQWIIDLVKIAYLKHEYYRFPYCQILFKDIVDRYKPDYERGSNIYCYQLMMLYHDSLSLNNVYLKFQKDLKDVFGLTATSKKQKIRCYIIKRSSKATLKYVAGNGESNAISTDSKVVSFTNLEMAQIVNFIIILKNSPVLFVDETNLTEKINLKVNIDKIDDYQFMKIQFSEQGFELEEGMIERPILQIEKK